MSSPLVDTDTVLLSKIASGDENAFAVLFERYRDKLFYYTFRHSKSREIAEEIVTDIFMKLWLGRELAPQINDIGAFLHKVGFYKVMDFLRTTARHSRLRQVYMDHFSNLQALAENEPFFDEELKSLLNDAVNKLPPKRKLIYRLSKQEGLTQEQIAEVLHLSPSTVNNSIVAATRSITSYVKTYAKQGHATGIFFML